MYQGKQRTDWLSNLIQIAIFGVVFEKKSKKKSNLPQNL